jgi:AcrR family transcriptional regulator
MANAKKSKPHSSTRDTLLRAASQVVIDRGVEALTLDAVAQQSGVSKGGLLYHFPNKDALFVGMIEQLIQDFESALQAEYEQDDALGTPGRWLRAYIRAILRNSHHSLALIARLSILTVNNPELLSSVEAYDRKWRSLLESDGLDPIQATIIQLAIDGLWFSEVFQFSALSEPHRAQIVEKLLAMTRAAQ